MTLAEVVATAIVSKKVHNEGYDPYGKYKMKQAGTTPLIPNPQLPR